MTMLVKSSRNASATDAEVTEVLITLALNGGRVSRTAEQVGMHEATLRKWRDRHAEDYARIQGEVVPQLYPAIAARCEGLAMQQADLEERIAERLSDTLHELRPGEAAGALRNVAVSKAVNVDKANLIRGRPSEIKVNLGAEDLLTAIGREYGQVLPALNVRNEGSSDTKAGTPRGTDTDEQRTPG